MDLELVQYGGGSFGRLMSIAPTHVWLCGKAEGVGS
jgi:hypothetical protein